MSFKQQLKDKRAAQASAPKPPRRTKSGREIPEPKVPAIPLDTIKMASKHKLEFMDLVDEHYNITQQMSVLNKNKARLTKALKDLCILYKLEAVEVGGLQANYYRITKAIIRKDWLLANGVSLKQILKSTEVKDESYGLRISEVTDQNQEQLDDDDEFAV
jgi:hypothetical protein